MLHYAEAWRVERVAFALHDREHTARREQAWDAAAAQVVRWFAEHPGGTAVVRDDRRPVRLLDLHLPRRDGPEPWSGTWTSGSSPGITAMQDLAARTGTPLVEGREALALFPMTAGADRFRETLERGDALVAYKFGRMLPETLAVLRGDRPPRRRGVRRPARAAR